MQSLTVTSPTPELRVRTEALPASARRVLAALAEGPRSFRDLDETLDLPGRTIRWAVRRLRDAGLVEQRFSLQDGRRSYFFLTGATEAGRVRPRQRPRGL